MLKQQTSNYDMRYIFIIGFIIGIIFCSSGLMGFIGGGVTGYLYRDYTNTQVLRKTNFKKLFEKIAPNE